MATLNNQRVPLDLANSSSLYIKILGPQMSSADFGDPRPHSQQNWGWRIHKFFKPVISCEELGRVEHSPHWQIQKGSAADSIQDIQGFMIAIMSRILWNPSTSKVIVFFLGFLALSEK